MAHILVVDDDADLRQLLLTALERDGHQVTALDRGLSLIHILKFEKLGLLRAARYGNRVKYRIEVREAE